MPQRSFEVQTLDAVPGRQIPSDLTYCYGNLTQWQPVITSENVTQARIVQDTSKKTYSLPRDIDDYSFDKVVETQFAQSKKFRAFNTPLSSSLLKLTAAEDIKDAIAISDLILQFINETFETDVHGQVVGSYVTQLGLNKPQLRDEIFCQLCCQTYQNNSNLLSRRAWLLLTACLDCFPPTDKLFKYLFKYVSDHGYGEYKQYCQHQLLDWMNNSQGTVRTYPPSTLEWEANSSCSRMAVSVLYPNNDQRTVQVRHLTTSNELAREVLEKTRLEDRERNGWTVALKDNDGLYESTGNEYVMDLLSEVELPPHFPYTTPHNLVSSTRYDLDPIKDRAHSSQRPRYRGTPRSEFHEPGYSRPQSAIQFSESSSQPSPRVPNPKRATDFYGQTPDPVTESLSRNRLNQRYHRNDNVEQWLDHVFEPVLDREELTDARRMSSNLKGGGGVGQQVEDLMSSEGLLKRLKGGGDPQSNDEEEKLKRQLEEKNKEAEELRKKIQELENKGKQTPSPKTSTTSPPLNGVLKTSKDSSTPPTTSPKPKVAFAETTEPSSSYFNAMSASGGKTNSSEEPYSGPSAATEKVAVNEVGADGHKVVRVGKIVWPPPKEEEKKKVLETGRLVIQENKTKGTLKLVGDQEISQRIQDKIRQEKEEATKKARELERIRREQEAREAEMNRSPPPPPPVPTNVDAKYQDKKDEKVVIDMKSRKNVLEEKLSVIYDKKDATTQSTIRVLEPVQHSPKPDYFNADTQTSNGVARDDPLDWRALASVRTQLYPDSNSVYLTYKSAPFKLELRKEFLYPSEAIVTKEAESLIFTQIVHDTYGATCIRMSKDDQNQIKIFLSKSGVTKANTDQQDTAMKRKVIQEAKKWPYYFAKIFAVNGGQKLPALRYLAVGHQGVRLLAREQNINDDQLKVIHHYRWEEIRSVTNPRDDVVKIHTMDGNTDIAYTPEAREIKEMVDNFIEDANKACEVTIAIEDYTSRDPTYLNFRRGNPIFILKSSKPLPRGWLYGELKEVPGMTGIFPASYIRPSRLEKQLPPVKQIPELPSIDEVDSYKKKYSMLDFALLYFRISPFRYETVIGPRGSLHGTFKIVPSKGPQRENWKDQMEMIRWSGKPIAASLIDTSDKKLNKLALMTYYDIMELMSDGALQEEGITYDKVSEILLACKNYPNIRDEIYCQLAKQTTENNRAVSLLLGWRLLSLITAWCTCSDRLKPYLLKYFEDSTIPDNRKGPHVKIGVVDLATICLQHIRATEKYNGRQNVPDIDEVTSVLAGRNTRRIQVALPGGFYSTVHVRSATVAVDVINEACEDLGVKDAAQKNEYVLFYVLTDNPAENAFCPVGKHEYVMDVTTLMSTHKKNYYFLIQRTSWIFPVFPNEAFTELYVEIMFHQVYPDWLDGYLLVVADNNLAEQMKDDIALLAAYLYRAKEENPQTLNQDYVGELVPKIVQNIKSMNLKKWQKDVDKNVRTIAEKTSHECRVAFLRLLSSWPLFGSTFYTVKKVNGKSEGKPYKFDDALVAINKHGLNIMDSKIHAVKKMHPFSQLNSIQRRQIEGGKQVLELKLLDTNHEQVSVLIETDKVSSMGSLISQYMMITRGLEDHSSFYDDKDFM